MLKNKLKHYISGAPRPGFVAGFVLACVLTAGVTRAASPAANPPARSESATSATPANIYGGAGKIVAQNDAGVLQVEVIPGNPVPMTTTVCANMPSKIVIVGTTAVQVPSTQLAGRKTLRICVSLENTGNPKVKCLANGTPGMTFTPDVGVPEGEVMSPGDCFVYPGDTSHVVKCISDVASTGVLTWEC